MRIEMHAYTDGGVELVRHIITDIPDHLMDGGDRDRAQDAWSYRVQQDAGAVLTRAQQALVKLEAANANVDEANIVPATINANEDGLEDEVK